MKNLPTPPNDDYQRQLGRALFEIISDIDRRLSAISKGFISAYAARSAVPTTGTWAQGDFVYNSAPSEAGAGGSKYVIDGWKCVVSGTPGTWVQCRSLTGN